MGSRSQTTQSLPPWAQPYAGNLLWSSLGLSSGADPSTLQMPIAPVDPNMYQKVAGFTPDQLGGMDYLRNTAGTSAGVAGAGAGQLEKTLAGDYLNPESNPYLKQTYDLAARGVTDQYQRAIAPSLMAQAQQGGVYGGSAMNEQQQFNQYGLGQNLNELATQIYGGNYQAERGRQDAGIGQLGGVQSALAAPGQQLLGVGTLQQGQTQAELDAARANAELKTEYPYKILSYLSNMLGSATGGGGQVSVGTSK